jgi:WD40 repeat protein
MYVIAALRERVDVWDELSKEHLATLRSACSYFPDIYSCSSDGQLLVICASNYRRLIVWDISDVISCKELQPLVCLRDMPDIMSVRFVKNSEQLVVGCGWKVVLFNARSGLLLNTISVEACAFALVHPVGDKIITVTSEGTVQKWDSRLIETGRKQLQIVVWCTSLSSSEESMAVGSESSIIIFDLTTWKQKKVLEGFRQAINVQFDNADSKVIVRLNYPSRTVVVDIINEAELFSIHFLGGMCFSSNQAYVYAVSVEGCICSLDVNTGASIPGNFSAPSVLGDHIYSVVSICGSANVILM